MLGILAGLVILAFGQVKKKISLDSIKKLLILILFILIPILPWFAKHAVEIDEYNFSNLITGGNAIPQIDFENDLAICNKTGFFEEYDRYIGYNDNLFLRIIELPWHLTMNDTGAIGAYVDMGFAFLGFILLGFLLYKPSKKNNFIVLFAVIYFLFWLIKANGVSWYGFPMFSLLVAFLAYTFTNMSKDTVGKIALVLVLGLWFLTAFDARLTNFAKPSLMLSHTGKVEPSDVQENIFPYSNELNAILEVNEGLVYKIGTPLGYFIPNYVERTYDDQLLDVFNCNYENKGTYDIIRNKMRDLGFRYVLYDSFTYTVGLDPEGTLQEKIKLFEQFASEHLMAVIYDDKRGHHLFYIPSDEELYGGEEPDVTIPEEIQQ